MMVRDPQLVNVLQVLEHQIMKYVPEQARPGVITFLKWLAFSVQGLRAKPVVRYTASDDEDTGMYPN